MFIQSDLRMQISRTGAQPHSEVNLFYTKPVTNSQSKEHDSKEDGAGLMYRNLPTIFNQRLNIMLLFVRFKC